MNPSDTNKEKKNEQKPAQDQNKRAPRRRYIYRKRSNSSKSSKSGQIIKFRFRKLSVLVPLYNEDESLRLLYNEIIKAVNRISCDYEILFVDDGSTDNSLGIIKDLRKKDNKVRYISFRTNYGKSAALEIGFKAVKGDVVVTMDADLQDDPAEIPNLLKKLEQGYDLVSGWKKVRHDPFIKKYTSRFFNFVTQITSGIKIHDFNCGLKAYRVEVVKSVNLYGELHRYIPVLADWQGFRISEIAVKHQARKFGKTKFGISRFFKGSVDLMTVLFTTRYIKRPMHLFGLLGMISFLLGFIVSLYLSIGWIFYNQPLSNRPLLFLGMLLIIVGVQFFSIGLLGEIMVHNFTDDKEYNIKDQG